MNLGWDGMDKVTTPVIFRVFRDAGDIIALFPAIPADTQGQLMQSYHLGQFGGADYIGLTRRHIQGWEAPTHPAKPAEYEEMKKDLEGRGYKLKVYSKNSIFLKNQYSEELKRMKRDASV